MGESRSGGLPLPVWIGPQPGHKERTPGALKGHKWRETQHPHEAKPSEDLKRPREWKEYAAINSMLDQINTCLDHLEEKNDHLHARLKELLESNRQTRVEFQQQQQQQLSEGPPSAKPHQ
ncbi:UPF0184 protein C9orf16 homolog isoform X1 [Trichosurus vulpecula]|uniref:UPF0184 protein C9orf16 homolog isoform X1 n=1 Tax=Trichosurus vulpecula TaxID=9337 RepID=UPI00186B0E05|nr:UPF0184 protein C9orf16 homolog isoform X1 [Trichosurus vulpecula]